MNDAHGEMLPQLARCALLALLYVRPGLFPSVVVVTEDDVTNAGESEEGDLVIGAMGAE
jgi:hypothetical protein